MDESQTASRFVEFVASSLPLWLVALVIALLLPGLAVLGHWIGRKENLRRGYYRNPPAKFPGDVTLPSLLALLGLLLGFTYSYAVNTANLRRDAMVVEATAIGTAFLRADLLSDPGRTELQSLLLSYAKTRVPTSGDLGSVGAFREFLRRSELEQAKLWPATLAAIEEGTPAAIRALVASGVTEVLDAHTRRLTAAAEGIPGIAKIMLVGVAGVAIFIVGNRSGLEGRALTWRTFVFSGILAVVLIVIIDIERSHEGLVVMRADMVSAAIADMEAGMRARAQP